MRFAVFLRAVNVGGTTPIKMAALRLSLEKEGVPTLTYMASGNLLIEATNEEVARTVLEKVLRHMAGRDVVFILRSPSELQELLALDPFLGQDLEGAKALVTFTESERDLGPRLPLASSRGDLIILVARGRELFSIYRKLNEKHAIPSDLIESLVGRRSTTRYWDTVLGLLEKEKAWRP